MSTNVGLEIEAAIARCEQHRAMCKRTLRARLYTVFGDDASGLTIAVWIAASNQEEQEKQRVTETIPWRDLDARAGEIVGIVDRLVAEVEERFGLRGNAA